MLSKHVRSHKQAYMAARHSLLNDTILCCRNIFCGIKDLLRRCNVIVCTRQQISGASDIVEIELPAQTNEFAFGKANAARSPTSSMLTSRCSGVRARARDDF